MVWRSLEPLASTVLANPGAHPVLYEAWRQGNLATSGRCLNVISTMASVSGMRLRHRYTGEQFATAFTGLSRGLLPGVGRDDESHEFDRATRSRPNTRRACEAELADSSSSGGHSESKTTVGLVMLAWPVAQWTTWATPSTGMRSS